jgi:hypothetical protein
MFVPSLRGNDLRSSDLPPDQVQLGQEATDLDNNLAALRARFDQYFMGLEKKNPSKDCAGYRKRLLALKGQFIRNTALKFRVQALWSKFESYERLWLKSLKEIEEGTYRLELQKLRRKNLRQKLDSEPSPASKNAEQLSAAPPPARAEPARVASPMPSQDVLPPDKLKLLYEAFLAAKKRCQESTDGLSLEVVAKSLRKQVPALMKARNAKSVDIKVVIRDGKAALKAVPRV